MDTVVLKPRSSSRSLRVGGGTAFILIFMVLAVAAGLWGSATHSSFLLRLGAEALIFGFLSLSVDILLGYIGLLSLGQAMFFGLAAYLAGLLLKDARYGFWLTMIVTIAAITPVAVIAGVVAIRSRGVYFILLTFAIGEVVAKAIYNTRGLGGSDGIIGIPVIQVPFGFFTVSLGSPEAFFFLTVAVMVVLLLGLRYLMATPFGHVLLAIRSNEFRLAFLGFNSWRYKLGAYVLAANVAAIGGAFYPMLRGYISPDLLGFGMSVDALIAAVLGGVGTLLGPVVGSVVLTALSTFISSYTAHHEVVVGAIFILCVIFMPRGLVGLLDLRHEKHRAASTSKGEA